MVEWYYLLVTLTLGYQVGDWVCERRWRKEREAEFDRHMAVLREQAAKAELERVKKNG